MYSRAKTTVNLRLTDWSRSKHYWRIPCGEPLGSKVLYVKTHHALDLAGLVEECTFVNPIPSMEIPRGRSTAFGIFSHDSLINILSLTIMTTDTSYPADAIGLVALKIRPLGASVAVLDSNLTTNV